MPIQNQYPSLPNLTTVPPKNATIYSTMHGDRSTTSSTTLKSTVSTGPHSARITANIYPTSTIITISATCFPEMLGELNGSHTGARYYSSTSAPATASLGAFYDESYDGDGLKITQIIAQGPLTKADNKITKGCIIEKINGKTIERGKDYYPMLAGKAGKSVMLTVLDPSTGKRFEEKVKPISYGTQSDLLYKRWVENNRKRVDQLSGGKVGYVHVKGMDSPSFRTVFSDLLGRYRNYDAVIVDTRHNGGGWLHDDLATLLDGKEYARYTPRNSYIGSDPFTKWLKPSCVLVCEDNYSNAHGFPWVYKTLGIGKLIGTPVPAQ